MLGGAEEEEAARYGVALGVDAVSFGAAIVAGAHELTLDAEVALDQEHVLPRESAAEDFVETPDAAFRLFLTRLDQTRLPNRDQFAMASGGSRRCGTFLKKEGETTRSAPDRAGARAQAA